MSTTKKRVAVIGLGTAGSMSAWRLASRGADVVGYEQFGTAHDRSAHAGESRIFRTAYFEDPVYVPLLRTAKALWRQLEGETGSDLLTLAGNLMLGDASSQMANVSVLHRQVRGRRLSHSDRGGAQPLAAAPVP